MFNIHSFFLGLLRSPQFVSVPNLDFLMKTVLELHAIKKTLTYIRKKKKIPFQKWNLGGPKRILTQNFFFKMRFFYIPTKTNRPSGLPPVHGGLKNPLHC